MIRILVEIFATGLQDYFMTSIVCSLYRIKEPYSRSFKIAYFQQILAYLLVNFLFSATPIHRILSGTVAFIVVGFFFFDGNPIYQIFAAISEYAMFLGVDLLMQFFLFPTFIDMLRVLPEMDMYLLGRNLATACFFLIYVLLQFYNHRKEGKHVLWVMGVSIIFALIQIIILEILGRANANGLLENGMIITTLFTTSLIGGYILVMELFHQNLRQQKKQSDLEQMKLEQSFQYEYYKKVNAQREQIRDMRHDMRNQLQTVRYLMMSTNEKDKERGKQILDELCEKVRNR